MKKSTTIKLLSPSVSQAEIKAVTDVLTSGWWGQGPRTAEFETRFAQRVGVKHAVAVSSGTAALHLAIHTLPEKAQVIVPAFTFVATAIPLLYEQKQVIFADIDEATLLLDPESVVDNTSAVTCTVIPVHYAGRLAPVKYPKKFTVIEDCAHAMGTNGAGRRGDLACWSFQAVKNLATGDGGMITTNNNELAMRMKKLRWYGISRSTWERTNVHGYSWDYDITELGFRYQTNDIMSALGLAQLDRITEMNRRRKQIAARYEAELCQLPIRLPPTSGNWHLYVIRVDKRWRNSLLDFLRQRGVTAGVHYKPLYYYPIFGKDIDDEKKHLPVTERVWQEVVSLPIYADLTMKEQDKVINELKKFFHGL